MLHLTHSTTGPCKKKPILDNENTLHIHVGLGVTLEPDPVDSRILNLKTVYTIDKVLDGTSARQIKTGNPPLSSKCVPQNQSVNLRVIWQLSQIGHYQSQAQLLLEKFVIGPEKTCTVDRGTELSIRET